MREIFVDINKKMSIGNSYKNKLEISRTKEGYYVEGDNEKHGPYLKIYTDSSAQFNNDVFVFGCNPDKIEVYRNGVFGLEETDQFDTTGQLAKDMRRAIGKQGVQKLSMPKIEGAEFVCESFIYECVGYSKEMRAYQYKKITDHNKARAIYRANDGQLFLVELGKKVRPLDEYQKFDSFEELNWSLANEKVDYGVAQSERRKLRSAITPIFSKLHKVYSAEEVAMVLQSIKDNIGLEAYRSGSAKLEFEDSGKFRIVDLDKLYEGLKRPNQKPLPEYYKKVRKYDWNADGSLNCYWHPEIDELDQLIFDYDAVEEFEGVVCKIGEEEKRLFLPLNQDEKSGCLGEEYCVWAKEVQKKTPGRYSKPYTVFLSTNNFSRGKSKYYEEIAEIQKKKYEDFHREQQKGKDKAD